MRALVEQAMKALLLSQDSDAAALFIGKIRPIISLIESLEWRISGEDGQMDVLERTILGTADLTKSVDLDSLLGSIPNNKMDISSKREVRRMLQAMSDYKRASEVLFNFVRDFPWFGEATVKLVQLSPASYSLSSTYPPLLKDTISLL